MLKRVIRRLRLGASVALKAARPLARGWREIALALAFVGGWVCLSAGVASVLPGRPVWLFSVGMFLWALGGLGTLVDIVREGLYVLWRAGK